MNKIITLVLAFILGCLAVSCFANDSTPLSPTEQRAVELEAEAKAARAAVVQERELERAKAKADWNSKTHLEAWKIRGQAMLDSAQWTGGRAVQYVAKADATIGHYGFVVPSSYVATSVETLANGAKAYADDAFDNTPKQVALNAGPVEVKVDVNVPAAE